MPAFQPVLALLHVAQSVRVLVLVRALAVARLVLAGERVLGRPERRARARAGAGPHSRTSSRSCILSLAACRPHRPRRPLRPCCTHQSRNCVNIYKNVRSRSRSPSYNWDQLPSPRIPSSPLRLIRHTTVDDTRLAR
ncbi:hypothetical protein T492DRAFT_354942 [Pavlovales sp. CCMP2436]|nr:hypothetical protein T492DRAFT_354942 [Pavlovales sp. CCMP2436]